MEVEAGESCGREQALTKLDQRGIAWTKSHVQSPGGQLLVEEVEILLKSWCPLAIDSRWSVA